VILLLRNRGDKNPETPWIEKRKEQPMPTTFAVQKEVYIEAKTSSFGAGSDHKQQRMEKLVVNHHHQVPFRLLKDVPELACGEPGTGNLIVEGGQP